MKPIKISLHLFIYSSTKNCGNVFLFVDEAASRKLSWFLLTKFHPCHGVGLAVDCHCSPDYLSLLSGMHIDICRERGFGRRNCGDLVYVHIPAMQGTTDPRVVLASQSV